jgi:hypothetical protein
VLGVLPDASHDDVKRAYTERALRWHPDRQPADDPAARERAEWHMREVNAAWQVLRSPASRAAYDDELRAAEDRTPEGSTHERPTSSGAHRRPSFADHLVDPRAETAPRHRGWRLWAPVLVVVALVVGILVATAYARRSGSDAPTEPEVHTTRFSVGDCVAVRPGPTVEGVPCDQPNTGRVVATTDYPRPCPSGTITVSLVEQQLSLCLSG